MNDEDIKL